jgi:hypothetical protein
MKPFDIPVRDRTRRIRDKAASIIWIIQENKNCPKESLPVLLSVVEGNLKAIQDMSEELMHELVIVSSEFTERLTGGQISAASIDRKEELNMPKMQTADLYRECGHRTGLQESEKNDLQDDH